MFCDDLEKTVSSSDDDIEDSSTYAGHLMTAQEARKLTKIEQLLYVFRLIEQAAKNRRWSVTLWKTEVADNNIIERLKKYGYQVTENIDGIEIFWDK